MTTQGEVVAKLRCWFTDRLPDGVFEEITDVVVDREEITVIGRIPPPKLAEDASEAECATAMDRWIKEFRERTRDARIAVAREAEHLFGRKVSWGVRCGDRKQAFTTLSVPVMTRLRQPERQVLDLLVDAGVARSRSDALAWCVRLVGKHAESWLADLREAVRQVERVRAIGPHTD
ncbi:hypothetical protein TH66_04405 [Carbonactinospora thermoautotrophica]|uniref:Uncharacterized protein n=1 Tax=Carbonactinospora thermoautotrophica TaxID=1469144 RepID=A0A132N4Q7_9ACTN|nr:hypothetical protein [Carbonactinospora thermoautotrophica]KWX05007.1 hypothetical protein TH66_04405 [Carbonactinospora thermoautotrophica]KWX10019.1 hypothetical protein TR74_06155 [Carbonactinospora thermoautotrophica]